MALMEPEIRPLRRVPVARVADLAEGTMLMVQLWFSRSRRQHADEVERLLAFARAEDPKKR